VSIAIDPRGRFLLGGDSPPAIYRLDTGELVRSIAQPNVMTKRGWAKGEVAYHAKGDFAVTAIGNTITTWDPSFESDGRTIVGKFDAARSAITSIVVLGDDAVITGHLDGVIRRWDLKQAACGRGTFKGHTKAVTQLALDASKRLLSASVDCTLRVWDLMAGTSSVVLDKMAAFPIAIDAVHGRVAVASTGLFLSTVHFPDGRRTDLPGLSEAAVSVAFHPDGRRLVSAASDLRLHDLETGDFIAVLDAETGPSSIAIVGERVVSLGAALRFWDLGVVPEIEIRARHADHVYDACVLDYGFATASGDCTIKLWRPDGSFITTLREHGHAVSALRALTHRRLVSCGYDRSVRVWDLSNLPTARVVRTFSGCKEWIVALAVSTDERRIAVVERLGAMRVWDLATGELVLRHRVGEEWPALALANERAFIGRKDGVIEVIDFARKETIAKLEGHVGRVSDLAIVGDTLISTGDQVRTWSLSSLELRKSFADHRARVIGVDLGDDFVATADESGFVLYWDLEKGPIGGRQRSLDRAPSAFAARLDGSILFGYANGDVQIVPPL